ncbi:unnamed protein product [Cylindrotheca closterium]|uniref:Uncharacterized protein n=1 Tax=Cylindrotheca closterium TaxID=2856 RepID=A0AAD2CQE4_9STRA|nr:unnamed protein product [Cylindrotheca closterium]
MQNAKSEVIATTAKPKKRVTFNTTVKGRGVLSIYDYSPREISAAWYNAEELIGITKSCFRIIARIQNGARNGKKYCTRGLEGRTRMGYAIRKKSRGAAILAVLKEQSDQWIDGGDADPEAIAEVYRKKTKSALLSAQFVGMRDQLAADAIHRHIPKKIDNMEEMMTKGRPEKPNFVGSQNGRKMLPIKEVQSLPTIYNLRVA